jgi:hypothetical protein
MTLILTSISKNGIVFASDRALTYASGDSAGEGLKTFPVKFLNAGLSLAGSYQVFNMDMDKWMPKFIEEEEKLGVTTLKEFASDLGAALEGEFDDDGGCLIHICGYVKEKNSAHPEFWFVRNYQHIRPISGQYCGRSNRFWVSEDFWERDCPDIRELEDYKTGKYIYHQYINGEPSGRIAYNVLSQQLRQFLNYIWSNPGWGFREPKTIEEEATYVKMYMKIICSLFTMSNYIDPPIGGEPDILFIKAPEYASWKKQSKK